MRARSSKRRVCCCPGPLSRSRSPLPGSTVPIHVNGAIVASYQPPCQSDGERHHRTPGVEIQFTALSDEDQSRISAWAIQNLYKKSS
ncbi:MAG: hypothetical protein KatS3mg082_0728 [Nitrospiraceae bacterium]|nr:MAG: hypothetical protein KatS3mg082_0728 [Nitrospiraceae bacterium]